MNAYTRAMRAHYDPEQDCDCPDCLPTPEPEGADDDD